MNIKNFLHTSVCLLAPLGLASAPVGAYDDANPDDRLAQAISGAPYIALAETGPREFDTLKDGELRKSTNQAFWHQKQTFKILKVYRNKLTGMPVKVGNSVVVPRHANVCLEFDITVQRKGNDLIIKSKSNPRADRTEPIEPPEKVFLLLRRAENPRMLSHFGLYVSPVKFDETVEKQILKKTTTQAKLGPATKKKKKSVPFTDGCNDS